MTRNHRAVGGGISMFMAVAIGYFSSAAGSWSAARLMRRTLGLEPKMDRHG
jgi:hypothetical protein